MNSWEKHMKTTLGTKIKQLRGQKQLTLEELALKIGSQKSYIWSIENDRISQPSAKSIALIADVLDTTVEALLSEDEPDNEAIQKDILYRNYKKLSIADQKKIDDIIKIWNKK